MLDIREASKHFSFISKQTSRRGWEQALLNTHLRKAMDLPLAAGINLSYGAQMKPMLNEANAMEIMLK
jgi:hypothetical protein